MDGDGGMDGKSGAFQPLPLQPHPGHGGWLVKIGVVALGFGDIAPVLGTDLDPPDGGGVFCLAGRVALTIGASHGNLLVRLWWLAWRGW